MIRIFTLICSLLIGVAALGQHRYLIIDRKLKQPMQISDSISESQLIKGRFAIEQSNAPAIIQKLDSIRLRLMIVSREKFDEFHWKFGTTTLSGKVVKWTYGDRLNIALSTDLGNGYTPSFYIVDASRKNKENAYYLKKLIAYINKYNEP